MKKSVRLWLKALRSGEFKQGFGKLGNSKVGYCCLGVACVVARENGVISRFNGQGGFLPEKVKDWLGLRNSGGEYGNNSLVHLNDSKNKTFDEIADVIEKRPEGLFVE